METRTITQYKIYVLWLNNMRGKAEDKTPVAAFDDLSKLNAFYLSQMDPWTDDSGAADYYGNVHSFNKTFKKGSLLEWFNPNNPGDNSYIEEAWVVSLNLGVPFNPS